MSDNIMKHSHELKERWARERMKSNFAPCRVMLDSTLNNTNATMRSVNSQRSRLDNQYFKMPSGPSMRNHTQTSTLLRPNAQFSQSHATQIGPDSHNSTISQSNMKYLLENTRKTFLKCLDAHILDFQNNTVQNEEQALLMYTALNGIVCDGMASRSSEKNEGQLSQMFIEFSKALDGLMKPSNAFGPSRTTTNSSSQHTDLGSESDPTEFEMAAFHSTQIGNKFEEPKQRFERNVVNNPPSSHSSQTKPCSMLQKLFQSKIGNKDRGSRSTMNANELKNSTSTPTEQWLDQSSATNDHASLSPDLNQSRIARKKTHKNASKINAARIKDSLTLSFSYTPITNWYIDVKAGDKIELFGCNLNNKPVSHGIVRSKKGDNLVKTNKGLFKLVGPMKQVRALPPQVRQQFKNDFPRTWKKTLNDSGLLK